VSNHGGLRYIVWVILVICVVLMISGWVTLAISLKYLN